MNRDKKLKLTAAATTDLLKKELGRKVDSKAEELKLEESIVTAR